MILVTGAFGNAGQYVIRRLFENGFDVIACDIKNPHNLQVAKLIKKNAKKYQKQLKIYWIDLTKSNCLQAPFRENKVTGVIHLAFIIPPYTEIKAEHSYQVNVQGTKNVITSTLQHAPNVPFVFSSSTTVFGPKMPDVVFVDENHPTKGTSNYTNHKLECEMLLRNSGLDWRILRFSAIMNPVFEPDQESAKFGAQISLTTPIEPVHVEDVATAVCHALQNIQTSRQIFIVSGGKVNQMHYKEYIYKLLNGILGKVGEGEIPWERFSNKQYYLHWYDTNKSQAILNYQSRNIEDFIRDARAHIPWWKKLLIKLAGNKIALKHFFPDK